MLGCVALFFPRDFCFEKLSATKEIFSEVDFLLM